MPIRIALSGGGTGGHIFPLVPVARALRARGADVFFMGPQEFPLDVLREENITVETIVPAAKFHGYLSPLTLFEVAKLPLALFQSLMILRRYRPAMLLGKGGYGTIAPVLAARMLKIPVVLHDSDAIPGRANRLLSRFARTIAVSFEETRSYFPEKDLVVTGNPVRLDHQEMTKAEARRVLGFETSRRIIFVIGGSQGALGLSHLVKAALPLILQKYAAIISTGEHARELFDEVNVNNAAVFTFLSERELAAAYVLSDLVISRSGSSSIFEIAAFGKASILVPFPFDANMHQRANAHTFEETGATLVLSEKDTNDQILYYAIEAILGDEERTYRMATAAKKFATPDAAKKLADVLLAHAPLHMGE
jgi:UDP-N-acetylglucosamine--N-acetylmuramyl-(pentapeptide) pyrophosphoryl-undecaprenol N-acetylglucosamine transferase